MPGAYHKIRFARADGEGFVEIDTTRPELIPACVALVAHPDDARYQPLFGTEVVTPLFGVKVPIRPHHLADPEKGTGIAMICTFGDLTDVIWWRELNLPVRSIIETNGTLRPITFGGESGRRSTRPVPSRRTRRWSAAARRRPAPGSSSSSRSLAIWWAIRGRSRMR